jgi:hypothetical protein
LRILLVVLALGWYVLPINQSPLSYSIAYHKTKALNKYQLLNGINDANKYAEDLRQRTGLVYFARYYSGHEKYPPINSDGQSILQDIISDADYLKDKISTYTPKQMSDAWNKMNALVVSLRKQELASK